MQTRGSLIGCVGLSFFLPQFAGVIAAAASNSANVTISTSTQTGIAIAVAFSWALIKWVFAPCIAILSIRVPWSCFSSSALGTSESPHPSLHLGCSLFRIDAQGWFNNFAMFWQISTAVVVVVVLYALGPSHTPGGFRSNDFVWLGWNNTTGFLHVDGYVVLIGMVGALFSFSGYEAGAHLAEETRGARRSAPIGIVLTCIISAVVGFWYLLGILYNLPPRLSSSTSSSSVSSTDAAPTFSTDVNILSSDNPVITVYYIATGSE